MKKDLPPIYKELEKASRSYEESTNRLIEKLESLPNITQKELAYRLANAIDAICHVEQER